MFRSFLSIALAATLLAVSPVSNATAATTADASKYVEGLGSTTLGTITNTKLSKEKKQATLEKLFSESVDIQWVGKFVVGRAWKTATDEQKARYLREYEHFIIQHYATRFTEYSTGSFKVTGTRDDGDNEFLVNMQISTGDANAEPVLLDYRVRADDKGKFRVFDIIIEGVSMITTQRSEFSSVVNNKGIDYLTDQMANRTLTVPAPDAAK